jgi:prophage regulatory protein
MTKLLAFRELKENGVLLGRRRVDQLEAEGKFPKRVPVSDWRVAWVADEIEAWVKSRIAARQGGLGVLGAGRDKRRGRGRDVA